MILRKNKCFIFKKKRMKKVFQKIYKLRNCTLDGFI